MKCKPEQVNQREINRSSREFIIQKLSAIINQIKEAGHEDVPIRSRLNPDLYSFWSTTVDVLHLLVVNIPPPVPPRQLPVLDGRQEHSSMGILGVGCL